MKMLASLMRKSILGLPIIALLGVFFFLPVLLVLLLAFRPFDATKLVGTEFTLENFANFLTNSAHQATFLRTVGISIATTALCAVLGFPVAWHLHQVKSGMKRLWLTLVVLLPLMISLVVASFSWALILGNNGVLNSALMKLGLIADPIHMMNTVTGVIIVSTFSHISYSILTIFAALENIDGNLHRAARIHGASAAGVFRHVVIPLSLPGIVAGSLIVFSLSMAAFVIPFLIGGGRVNVVPLLIYQYTMQFFNWPGAATLSIMLLFVTLFCSWLFAMTAQRWMPWERPR